MSPRTYRRELMAVALVSLFYASVTFVNHWNFRTSAWDLGLANQALYKYSQFVPAPSFLVQPPLRDYLGGHFELWVPLLSPLRYLFGTWTLLLAQWSLLPLSLWALFALTRQARPEPGRSRELFFSLGLLYVSFWGLLSAFAFDFHGNTMAALLVLPLAWAFHLQRIFPLTVLWLLFLFSKENCALWGAFLPWGFLHLPHAGNNEEPRRTLLRAAVMSLTAALTFVLITQVLQPAINGGSIRGWGYQSLGPDSSAAFLHLITSPWEWIPRLGDEAPKQLFLAALFLSGSWLFLLKPLFLVSALPLLLQKLLADSPSRWGLDAHYLVEFSGILVLAAYSLLAGPLWEPPRLFGNMLARRAARWAWAGSLLVSLGLLVTYQSPWFSRDSITGKGHYLRPFSVLELRQSLRAVPKSVALSAHYRLVPHLAFRDTIYAFPDLGNASYVAYLVGEGGDPAGDVRSRDIFDSLSNSPEWVSVPTRGPLALMRKVP